MCRHPNFTSNIYLLCLGACLAFNQKEALAGALSVIMKSSRRFVRSSILLDTAPVLHVEQLEVELEEGRVPHRRLELRLVIALVLATVPQQHLPRLGEQLLPLVEKC